MKKILLVILCLFTIASSTFVVQAENSVSVRTENIEVKNNRLFDVDIYVDSTFNLTAATFEISYDSSMIEYREVDTEIDNGMVKATDKHGKVKAIFLKSDGVSLSGELKLFSAKFKSVSSGTCNVTISMYDCVDNNAVTLNLETSTQLIVTISGNSSDAITDSKESKIENDTSNTDEEPEEKTIKYLDVTPPENNEKKYLIIIVLLVLSIMGLLFYIDRLKNKKEKQKISTKDLDNSAKSYLKGEITEKESEENEPNSIENNLTETEPTDFLE